ncbi:hypothetical protein F5X68DRAFT_221564 [Plectosphaerella plurivora]|uniref:Uncharacterized protein n=1 Tax=Plectosphaerella plurivora TaxID=936078 RepID=A0A9P8VCT4_9PEZI|nr:hypothetical protein F5X68DRAFT_221564 [Plectosphaerella plurivora]
MPQLEDITYSREGTIAAVRGYYAFLTSMYLDEAQVIHPPPTGWPSIVEADPGFLRDFGKSDEVIHLLAHLPYLRSVDDSGYPRQADGAPDCELANWQDLFPPLRPMEVTREPDAEGLRIITEGPDLATVAPPHLFALTAGHRENYIMALDTQLGIVHWEEYTCPQRIARGDARMGVDYEPDSDDDVPEGEADWRYSAPAWTVEDFFEVLKDQFKQLHWLPISPWTVRSADYTELHNTKGLTKMLQDIYRQHGWPDLAVYNKAECLKAVQKAVQKAVAENYPDSACYRSR